MRLQQWIQFAVLRTAVPPFLALYRGIYYLAIRHFVGCIRRKPGVLAVYLRRGCARGEILPAISDVDMTVILEERALPAVNRAYRNCARLWPMLKGGFDFYTPTRFQAYYTRGIAERLLATEGRVEWKRLAGEDFLRSLPVATPEQLRDGCYLEILCWWSLFALVALPLPASRWAAVWERVLCYRATAQFLRLMDALESENFLLSPKVALAKRHAPLRPEDRPLIERLATQERARFLKTDPTLCEETLALLLRLLREFHRREGEAPRLVRPEPPLPQRVDSPPEERYLTAAEEEVVGQIIATTREAWGASYQGAALMPSAYCDMEDLVLLLEADPERLPHREALDAVIQVGRRLENRVRRNFQIHLSLPECTFRLSMRGLEQQHRRSIFSQFFFPDVWMQRGETAFWLDGTPPQAVQPPLWTQCQREYLCGWRSQPYYWHTNPLLTTLPPGLSPFAFLRSWWKALQLLAIERSIHRGEVVYPLTLPAVRRALAREGIPLPLSLLPLEEAFYSELRGEPTDVSTLLPEASKFLWAVNAQTQETDIT